MEAHRNTLQLVADMPEDRRVVHKDPEGHMTVEVEAGTMAAHIDHKLGQDLDLDLEESVADTLQLVCLQLGREAGKTAEPGLRAGKAVVVAAHMEWVVELEEDRGHWQLPMRLVVEVEGEEGTGQEEVHIVL